MTEQKSVYNVDQTASANAYFDAQIGEESVRLMLTSRFGATSEQVADAAINLIEAYVILRAKYPKAEKVMPVEEPTREHPAPEGEKKKYEKKPIPADQIPPELPSNDAEGGGVYFRDDFTYFIIKPEPDEKATVEFYKEGLEFPVVKIVKWKAKNVVAALQRLGEFDAEKAATHKIHGYVLWTEGKEYEYKGEKRRYKDVVWVAHE